MLHALSMLTNVSNEMTIGQRTWLGIHLISALHLGPSSRPLISALHLGPSSRPFISTLDLDPSSRPFISTLHLGPSSRPLISALDLDPWSRPFISTLDLDPSSRPFVSALDLGPWSRPFISALHLGPWSRPLISTLHLGPWSRPLISALDLGPSSRPFISTLHLGPSSRPLISALHLGPSSRPSWSLKCDACDEVNLVYRVVGYTQESWGVTMGFTSTKWLQNKSNIETLTIQKLVLLWKDIACPLNHYLSTNWNKLYQAFPTRQLHYIKRFASWCHSVQSYFFTFIDPIHLIQRQLFQRTLYPLRWLPNWDVYMMFGDISWMSLAIPTLYSCIYSVVSKQIGSSM